MYDLLILAVLVRFILLIVSVVLLTKCFIGIFGKRKAAVRSIAVMLSVALLIPYLLLYHGMYRTPGLRITEENIGEIVSIIEKLEYKQLPPAKDGSSDYHFDFGFGAEGTEYIGTYESDVDNVTILIDAYRMEKQLDNQTLAELSGTAEDRSFVPEVFLFRYDQKIKQGQSGSDQWITSPLVALTLDEPLLHCGYLYCGGYNGNIDIQAGNIYYRCTYYYETKDVIFRWLTCVRPHKYTAIELLTMFQTTENKYGYGYGSLDQFSSDGSFDY